MELVITKLDLIYMFVGFILGWIAKHYTHNTNWEMRTFLSIIITIVWTSSIFAELFLGTAPTSTYIHLIMGAVVGSYFDIDKFINFRTKGK